MADANKILKLITLDLYDKLAAKVSDKIKNIELTPGPKGDTGPQGPAGAAGAKGSTGDRGPQGYTFTPKVDASGNLSWTNNGDLDNPSTVNIKGPQGEKGPAGDRGLQGLQGATGPQGPTGPKGDKGDTGPQGPAGSDATVTVDSSLDSNSSHPVQNKVINAALDEKVEYIRVPYIENAAYVTFASVPIAGGHKSITLLVSGCEVITKETTGAWIVDLKAYDDVANMTVVSLCPPASSTNPPIFGYYKTSDTIYFGVYTPAYRRDCAFVKLSGRASSPFTIKNLNETTSQPSGWTPVTPRRLSNRAATTKVIGTTQSDHTIADCDYLCDGTADNVEIENAINALPTGGGKVVLLEGTYNISQVIHLNKSNVTIQGMGQATVLKRSFQNNPLWWIGNEQSNICFRDFRIEGDYSEIFNMGIYGIALNNIIIEKIHIYNEFAGIHLKDSNNITVRDCYITCSEQESATDYGIVIATPGGGYNQPNQYWKVYGNTVSNYKTGIGVLQAEHCLIENNIITDCGIGCKVDGTNNQVHGNYIIRGTGKDTDYSSTQDTIRVSGTYNDISDNYISGKNYINSGGTTNTFNNNRYQ